MAIPFCQVICYVYLKLTPFWVPNHALFAGANSFTSQPLVGRTGIFFGTAWGSNEVTYAKALADGAKEKGEDVEVTKERGRW